MPDYVRLKSYIVRQEYAGLTDQQLAPAFSVRGPRKIAVSVLAAREQALQTLLFGTCWAAANQPPAGTPPSVIGLAATIVTTLTPVVGAANILPMNDDAYRQIIEGLLAQAKVAGLATDAQIAGLLALADSTSSIAQDCGFAIPLPVEEVTAARNF